MILELKKTLDSQLQLTENGALGYRTSGKALLDMNFAVTSMRNESEDQIIKRFGYALSEDRILALKWLFFARDVRQGLGERRTFRIILKYLAKTELALALKLVDIVAEYGRYDDLWELLSIPGCNDKVVGIIYNQISEDLGNFAAGKSISLIAKWLPSINTSSKEKVSLAKAIANKLKLSEKQYRKMLSKLRAYLDVVEVKMSSRRWSDIDYSKVPSKANVLYNAAFFKNDCDRREAFITKVEKGEETINAGVLYPHDIVHKYGTSRVDPGLEALWKALPATISESTMVVADGSGSMYSSIGNTNVMAIEVANALAIYFAQGCQGEFKDKYITFSMRPQLVDLSKSLTLREKINTASRYNEVADTNIEAVFNLILKTAIDNGMKQSDLPANVLILSDMEFNSCARSNSSYGLSKSLFETIGKEYVAAGYTLPRLIFWNIMSRTCTIPLQENENGVTLVSGFSINTIKMVMSGKLDPYLALVDTLNDPRYDLVEVTVNS